jgi:hypothetical protein
MGIVKLNNQSGWSNHQMEMRSWQGGGAYADIFRDVHGLR